MILASLRAAALALPLLAACTLIDQNTFNPHAGDAPVVPPPPAAPKPVPPGPPALLVIAPGATGYGEVLAQAVAAARARKPDVVFDVVEIQPQDAAATVGLGANAAAVAAAITRQGVPPERVRLVARPETGGRRGEVRVYVR